VPFVVPDVLKMEERPPQFPAPESAAVWSDVASWLPWDLWRAYGDRELLAEQFDTMAAHVRRVETLVSASGLWDAGFQFGDWLDPTAPPDAPFRAQADSGVVATACLYRSATTTADAAEVLGRTGEARDFRALAERTRAAFNDHYVSEDGTVRSDCPTVYALAIVFGLLSEERRAQAGVRLARLVGDNGYRIATGFAGTPYVTDALTATGHLEEAYRLLQERECPSWLYSVTMGATTIWERWDSMLPDGTINPGEMTSFNHYALGAVADWMHRVIGGLSPLEPGYDMALVAPQPGGGLTSASTSLQTPHGRLAVSWSLTGNALRAEVTVPDGVTAVVRLPGVPEQRLSGGTFEVLGAG
jgi:alpha-L-rhamnosidase